jgi:hypothetical protein
VSVRLPVRLDSSDPVDLRRPAQAVPLPMGREAVERALLLCMTWGGVTPNMACAYAWQYARQRHYIEGAQVSAWWLPEELRCATVAKLKEQLRAQDGVQ